jgi:hypothetical protein
LETVSKDKHFSLFDLVVSDKVKRFHNIETNFSFVFRRRRSLDPHATGTESETLTMLWVLEGESTSGQLANLTSA